MLIFDAFQDPCDKRKACMGRIWTLKTVFLFGRIMFLSVSEFSNKKPDPRNEKRAASERTLR
jgi:hypothetical protein